MDQANGIEKEGKLKKQVRINGKEEGEVQGQEGAFSYGSEKREKKTVAKGTFSILDMDIYEEKRQVDSPLSMKACQMEGLLPKDLLHVPLAAYQNKGDTASLAELKYSIYEAKRVRNLELVRQTRRALGGSNTEGSAQSVKKKGKGLEQCYQTLPLQVTKAKSWMGIKTSPFIVSKGSRPLSRHSLTQGLTSQSGPQMIDSRYISSRNSEKSGGTKNRRQILRHFSSTTSITSNALTSHSQAFVRKEASYFKDLVSEVKKFNAIVQQEQERQRNMQHFNLNLDKYQSQRQDFLSSQEKSLKLKSDASIRKLLTRETSAKQRISEEQRRFKEEHIMRKYESQQSEAASQARLQRAQSAKVMNETKRQQALKRAQSGLKSYFQYLEDKIADKEAKEAQVRIRSDTERHYWLQNHQQSLRDRMTRAQLRQQELDLAFSSPQKQQEKLMRIYSDIEVKERRWSATREATIQKLKSANERREEKAKEAWSQHLEELKNKDQMIETKKVKSHIFLDKITQLKSDQLRHRMDIQRVKRQMAESTLKINQRKMLFQQTHLQTKIQGHQEAYSNLEREKQRLDKERLKRQFDLEMRKAEIRETLYRMQVWNCWDQRVLDLVFARAPGVSIDTVVRRFASEEHASRESDIHL